MNVPISDRLEEMVNEREMMNLSHELVHMFRLCFQNERLG